MTESNLNNQSWVLNERYTKRTTDRDQIITYYKGKIGFSDLSDLPHVLYLGFFPSYFCLQEIRSLITRDPLKPFHLWTSIPFYQVTMKIIIRVYGKQGHWRWWAVHSRRRGKMINRICMNIDIIAGKNNSSETKKSINIILWGDGIKGQGSGRYWLEEM